MKKDILYAIKSRMRKDDLASALTIAQRAGMPLDEFNKLARKIGKERLRKGLVQSNERNSNTDN